MRVKARIAKAEAAKKQTTQLTGIVTEEVSIVDRAANKRVFLVVKNAGAAGAGATTPQTDDAGGSTKMKISSTEKARIAQVVKSIQDALAAVSNTLETAEEIDGAETPAELTKALVAIAKLVGIEPTAEGDVEKAGRKISAARLETMRQAHALLGEVISGAEPTTPPAEETEEPPPEAAVKAKKSAPLAVVPPPAPVVAAADPATVAAIRELTDTVQVLVKAVGIQKKRIDTIAANGGGSRQQPVEKGDEPDDKEQEVAWPLDMNRPHTKANTPVEKSFFE